MLIFRFFILSLLAFALTKESVKAGIIKAGEGQLITSIRAAIEAAQPYDTVEVSPGVYRQGNILIDKPLTLNGIGYPVLDGEKQHEPVSIRSPYVTVKGFSIHASGHSSMVDIAGIKIYNTHHVSIIDNILEDNFFGIYAQEVKNGYIANNRITAYGKAEQLIGNGIHGWKSDSLIIENNTVTGHRDGVYLEFVTHTEVHHNLSEKNLRYGLHFMFSHDNGYRKNTFSNNGAGVAVMYTKRVVMQNNIFTENGGDAAYGLLLKEITDSRISHNTFSYNTTAILMEGSSRVHIERNAFEANGWALKIQASCSENTITLNNFIQNTFDVATNGSLVLNNFDTNYWDKYEGYDLNKDKTGDIPYRPVSLYSMIVEKYPMAMILFRSFMVSLLDRSERFLPSLTPENLKDNTPVMKAFAL